MRCRGSEVKNKFVDLLELLEVLEVDHRSLDLLVLVRISLLAYVVSYIVPLVFLNSLPLHPLDFIFLILLWGSLQLCNYGVACHLGILVSWCVGVLVCGGEVTGSVVEW